MKHHLPLTLLCVLTLTGCAQKQAPDSLPDQVPASSSSSPLINSLPSAPAISSPSLTDGNVGAACTSNEECKTPGEFLMMSSCPFTSRCIAHRCAVVCPAWKVVPDGSGSWKSQTATCHADTDCDCTYSTPARSRCSCIEGACMAVMK